ncbi:hypothetical protein BS50DRAFT_589739 [Corynespora cassiicola Philippines]|uniref:Uncharacterized protein n=1 Tax=Corynespora cassiicola Philippines TaxID=1448308 RepID=A0A2T2NIU5_CORCC|nr:hypothetical protein BS50DRAFT_589739 [Corynespora cassiicola Philippines]
MYLHSPRQGLQHHSSDINPTPNLGYDQLWKLQHHFYRKFIYPNNVEEAASINSTIFSENVGEDALSIKYHTVVMRRELAGVQESRLMTCQVQGRVSDTRNFQGRELNTEYIFGLFVPSESKSIIGQPRSYNILKFLGEKNIASASTRVDFTFPAFGNISMPVILETWLTWNSAGQITQYDAIFKWFGYFAKTLVTSLDSDPNKAGQKAVKMMATSICSAHGRYCNGTNLQYESYEACSTFLTREIRVGESFELGMNTLFCRSMHENMLKYRPDVHCSHIGPTGGGMCEDDVPYMEKAGEVYYTNSPWSPSSCT